MLITIHFHVGISFCLCFFILYLLKRYSKKYYHHRRIAVGNTNERNKSAVLHQIYPEIVEGENFFDLQNHGAVPDLNHAPTYDEELLGIFTHIRHNVFEKTTENFKNHVTNFTKRNRDRILLMVRNTTANLRREFQTNGENFVRGVSKRFKDSKFRRSRFYRSTRQSIKKSKNSANLNGKRWRNNRSMEINGNAKVSIQKYFRVTGFFQKL